MTTLFPVRYNLYTNGPLRHDHEVLILAAPENFEWIRRLGYWLLSSDNPALSGLPICMPTAHDACETAIGELDSALARARHLLYVATEAFEAPGLHRQTLNSMWTQDPACEQGRVIPVQVDDFRQSGIFGTITPIDLRGLSSDDAKSRLIDMLSSSIVGSGRTRMRGAIWPGVAK